MEELPVRPSHEPSALPEPSYVPSQRAPTLRPLSHLAQSVDAADHSPSTVQRLELSKELRLGMSEQANCVVAHYAL